MSVIPHLSTKAMTLGDVPAKRRKHVDPKAPFPRRDRGAKGRAPGLTPEDMAIIFYQLQYDPEERLRETATKNFEEMPAEIATPVASAALPEPVLDFCARRWLGKRNDLLEALIRNPVVADGTIIFLASKCSDRLAEIVAENQVRLERSPMIVEQLYKNPNAHQSLIDRVLEFVHRRNLDINGLPGIKQAIAALVQEQKRPEEQSKGPDDATFAAILKGSIKRGEKEEKEGITTEKIESKLDEFSDLLDEAMEDQKAEVDFDELAKEAEEGEGEEEEEKRYMSRQVAIQNMGISQKVRLASLGSREDRSLLVRDPNRLVHMAAILSPKIQDADLKEFAGNKDLPKTIINYIANKKGVTRDYGMLLRLCNNPKLELAKGMRMLNHLRNNDLRTLSRSRNVNPMLAKAAKNLMQKRQGGRG